MKPYPNYKGNNLTDIEPKAIAFVTEGANRRKFFLFKSKERNVSMKKETAILLIKSGKLSEDEQKAVLESVADADKVEVQKAIDEQKKPAPEIDVAKVADAIVKAIEPKLSAIAASLKDTTAALEKLVVAKKTDDDPELSDEEAQKLIDEAIGKEGN